VFSAEVVNSPAIYSCKGARDEQREPLWNAALATGALMKMKSVRRDAHARRPTPAWFKVPMCAWAARKWEQHNTNRRNGFLSESRVAGDLVGQVVTAVLEGKTHESPRPLLLTGEEGSERLTAERSCYVFLSVVTSCLGAA